MTQALKRLAGTRYGATDHDKMLFALGVLCGESPEEAIEPVLVAAQARDSALRRAGIEGLGVFGPDAAAPAPVVVAAVSDPDPDVQAAGRASLEMVLRRNEPDEKLRAAVRHAVDQYWPGGKDVV